MRLEIWQKLNGKTIPDLAELFDVPPPYIYKYLYDGTIPKRPIMKKIFFRTRSQVRADDFYGTTFEIYEKELLKTKNIKIK